MHFPKPKLIGAALMVLGLAAAAAALAVWLPPEREQIAAGDQRDLGVGIMTISFSIPLSFLFSTASIVLSLVGTLKAIGRLRCLSSWWWVVVLPVIGSIPLGFVNLAGIVWPSSRLSFYPFGFAVIWMLSAFVLASFLLLIHLAWLCRDMETPI